MVSIEDFRKIELKVAEIVKVELHPNADRLWLLRVRVGEEERQIVAGIRQFYTAEQLLGRKVVLVSNLEPAEIRGVTSQGMLLAASAEGKVVLISLEKDVPSGSIIK